MDCAPSSFNVGRRESAGPKSLLSGGQIAYPHSFSELQMKTLAAVIDTFVASLSYDNFGTASDARASSRVAFGESNQDEIRAFYELSASQADVPLYAAGLMHSKLKPGNVQLLHVILWLLSSRVGTYLLCGRASLCRKFPFVRSFGEIPVSERGSILISAWSRSPYVSLRAVFDGFKILSLYSHYSKVDEKGYNPTWKAISYCGPDPVALEHRKTLLSETPKPLDGSVLDAEVLGEKLLPMLEAAKFTVTEDVTHLERLWENGGATSGKSMAVKCDVVIVGSGAGGGVVAGVLAKAGYKVIVVEKGKYFARDDLSLLEGPSLDQMYEGGGLLSTDDGSVLLLAGATVGGGTAVNWCASFKTPVHVLEEWAEEGLSLFQSRRYEEAMEAVIERLGVKQKAEQENLQNSILRMGCERLGYKVDKAPRNCQGAEHDCGWCGFGCWSGTKQATSETWLSDAASAGAVVVSSATARAVLLYPAGSTAAKGHRAGGIVAKLGGTGDLLYIESRITVAAGGALNTPPLLLQSGLKNASIGKNLHLHPVQMVWGYFPVSDHVSSSTSYSGGTITSYSTQFASWYPRGYGCILQCPSAHPGFFSVLAPWLSAGDSKDRMRRFSRTVHVFALARDRPSGTVGLCRRLEYTLHPDDHANLLASGVAALRVLIAAGASEIGTTHRYGDRLVITPDTTDADVEDFFRRVKERGLDKLGAPICSAHQMGSCRMGPNPATSAVDPNGESWEVSGLFVADASVFPSAIGINPMVTIQSIAYCIAHSALDFLNQNLP